MTLLLSSFNPFAGERRACDVTPGMMVGQPLPLEFLFFRDEAERVHRPTFSYLTHMGLGAAFDVNGRWHRSDERNAARALQQWADVLNEFGLDWEDGGAALYRLFADRLMSRVNERTGDTLSSKYMSDLARYVAKAYAHTNAKGFTAVELEAELVIAMLSDEDLDIPADAERFGVRTRRRLRRKGMTEEEWADVAARLGPLLLEGWSLGMASMRPRTSSEFSLQTGARVAEVAQLPYDVVMALPWDGGLDGHVVLTLYNTKGRRVRDVLLPRRVLAAMRHYAGTERAIAVEMMRDREGEAFVEPKAFFVNGPTSPAHAGRPVSTAALQADLRAALRAARLVDQVEVRLPGRGMVKFEVARSSFHSLRHTFAIWMYHARKFVLKDPEPWKYISARLGHAQLSTTLDVYLDVGRMLEPQIGRLLRETFLAAIDWAGNG